MTTVTVEPHVENRVPPVHSGRARWFWLVLGAVLLPFTMFQTISPLAAWLAPLFLLRFVRTTRARVGLPLIAVVGYLATVIALRGIWPAPGVYLWALPGLGLVLTYGADKLLSSRMPKLLATLIFPMADTALGYLAGLDPSSAFASWGAPGYTQTSSPILLQSASLIGMWGIGFVIMWTASVINTWWEHGFRLAPVRVPVGVWVVTMTILLVFGSVGLAVPGGGETVQIAAVVPDPGLDEARSSGPIGPGPRTRAEREEITERYLTPTIDDLFEQTRMAAAGGAEIIAWSEAAAYVFAEDEDQLIERARGVALDDSVFLEIGLISILATDYPANQNRSVLIGPDGNVLWDYEKSSAVPGDGNQPGPGVVPVVDTPHGRLAVVICFDADFPALVRQAGSADADILIVPSSDWEQIARSHSDMAVVRAVENGVTVIRPTRNGYTSVIDPLGRVLAFGPSYFGGDVPPLMASVPTQGRTTVYSRAGDVVAVGSAFGIVLIAGFVLVRSVMARRRGCSPSQAAR